MAEVVHRNLEAMLPQLEELETSGIFTHEEIRTIIKFRRTHEYRMVRRPAHKEDFLAAIQYELHLDLLRKHRKKRLGVTRSRRDADYGIQNRVHGLFRRVLKKFKGDLKLWLQYIDFAKKSNHKLSLSRIYGRALAIHPASTALWVMAAKFQFEDMKDVSSARSLLQQGLRANATSQHLWLEYFRMELMHTDKVVKRKDGLQEGDTMELGNMEEDGVLTYKVASVVFQQAIKAMPSDIEFHLAFLPISRLFSGTESLQSEVYESLRNAFPCHPLTWDALARRPWLGVDTSAAKACEISELESQVEQIFEEGISTMTAESSESDPARGRGGGVEFETNNVATLWECYFKWALERLEETSTVGSLREKAEQRIVCSFKEASSSGQLTVQTYQHYIGTLKLLNQHAEADLAVCSALKTHPTSVQLWLLRLGMVGGAPLTTEGGGGASEERELGEVCRDALKHIPMKVSLPIWQHWLERIMDTSNHHLVEETFKSGVGCECREVSEPLSELYLEWSYTVGGLPKARKVYEKLMEAFPVPYSLYEKSLELEQRGLASSNSGGSGAMTRLRRLYERTIRDYGSTHVDIWLKYICAELHLEEGNVSKVVKIHWRAMKDLQPDLIANFMEQYSLLLTTDKQDSAESV